MSVYFLVESDFSSFINQLLASSPVIAPVAKKSKFVFADLKSATDLRLDYDVTILPPKAAFFPVKQKLLDFKAGGATSAINPRKQILFGVHFYDIKGIDMLDQLFADGHRDNNYLANREATTLVGSNIQKISTRAFWGSVGTGMQPKGHDAFLTHIPGGYVFETRTKKGEDLVKFGAFRKATEAHTREAENVNALALKQCPEKLEHSSDVIATKVRSAFSNEELWTELSKDCFSCGSCNIVCPSCYCFDVQDRWNLDQVSGTRSRTWDACMTNDFSKVSLGAGGSENFRERRAQRFRHRVMRKATYLNEKLGGPACVGCGRCSVGCVPDIADPVRIINRIVGGRHGSSV